MKRKLKSLIVTTIRVFNKPEMAILPGQMAFFLVLSFIPVIAIIAFISSVFLPNVYDLRDFITTTFPGNVSELILPLLYAKWLTTDTIIFFITSLFLSHNGVKAMINAANHLYKVPNANFLRVRIKAMLIMFTIVTLIIFILLVPVLGSRILDVMYTLGLLPYMNEQIKLFLAIFKWPITVLCIYLTTIMVYTVIPDTKVQSREVTTGALFTTTAWIIITYLVSLYVNNISAYHIFYGSLSNIIVLLLWVYLLSIAFVIGLIINVAKYEKTGNVEAASVR